jgi:hypothetical protein
MAKISPTQRSLKYLREQGYIVHIAERWNAFAKIRQDAFGFVDLIAVGKGETVGVQTTSYSNISKRVAKITESEHLPVLREAGWRIVVHGWKKDAKTKKQVLKAVDLS